MQRGINNRLLVSVNVNTALLLTFIIFEVAHFFSFTLKYFKFFYQLAHLPQQLFYRNYQNGLDLIIHIMSSIKLNDVILKKIKFEKILRFILKLITKDFKTLFTKNIQIHLLHKLIQKLVYYLNLSCLCQYKICFRIKFPKAETCLGHFHCSFIFHLLLTFYLFLSVSDMS